MAGFVSWHGWFPCRLAEALEDEGGGGKGDRLPYYGTDGDDSQLLGKGGNKGVSGHLSLP